MFYFIAQEKRVHLRFWTEARRARRAARDAISILGGDIPEVFHVVLRGGQVWRVETVRTRRADGYAIVKPRGVEKVK